MIKKILHNSGLIQEAIILFPNDKLSNYVVFEDVDNEGFSIIEVDRSSGFSIKENFKYLKTLCDKEIFNKFYKNNKKSES